MDSGQNVEQNAGGGRQAPEEDVSFAGINLLEGRTGARSERDVRGQLRQESQGLPQNQDRVRDGNRQPSRPESYRSAGSVQRDEKCWS